MVRRITVGGLLVLLYGCSDRPSFAAGEGCELNSDCAPPLVCRLDRCRVECRGLRDCAPGFLCVRDDEGLGACQLDDDRECTLTSQCAAPLVCVHGQCTNECATSADCPAGALCRADDDGALGCVDPSDTQCELNSDCGPLLICAPDRRCREQCRFDRDCRDGLECVSGVCTRSGIDAGPMDGGLDAATDAGLDAAPPIDGGSDAGIDGGPPPSLGGLSAGSGHTCAVTSTPDVRCWGVLAGSGDETPSVALSEMATFVTSGSQHVCAGTATQLLCWGDNTYGELSRDPATLTTSPTPVVTLPAAVRSAAGGVDHTCAVATDGTVSCWGRNASGQLGDGTTTDSFMPRPVTALPAAAVDIAARNLNSCAVLVDGTVWCWGSNDGAQLGEGASGLPSSATPIRVAGIDGAAEVDVGSRFACARIAADGSLWCWGRNSRGELAQPVTTAASATPLRVTLPGPVAEIEAGQQHACARLDSGDVLCWGDNGWRQTGTAGPNPNPTPTMPPGLSGNVTELAVGDNHACVRLSSPAEVRCWGFNNVGQLGQPMVVGFTETPMTVTGLP